MRRGFTLLEILVVLAIIGLLVGVLVNQVGGGFKSGQEATAKIFVSSTIKTALITDLEVSWKIIDSVKLTAGANNLFNYYPDRLNYNYRFELLTGNANGYVTQFPTFSPFGLNGGYYYGKVAYTF